MCKFDQTSMTFLKLSASSSQPHRGLGRKYEVTAGAERESERGQKDYCRIFKPSSIFRKSRDSE